jgi:hypothetical protein
MSSPMDRCYWVIYPWSDAHGPDLVHPEDLEQFRRIDPLGRAFAVMGQDGEFLVLAIGGERFRVKPSLATEIPIPHFAYGQDVRVKNGNKIATVLEINWHYKRHEPYYMLLVGGKPDKRRYWSEELSPIDD